MWAVAGCSVIAADAVMSDGTARDRERGRKGGREGGRCQQRRNISESQHVTLNL